MWHWLLVNAERTKKSDWAKRCDVGLVCCWWNPFRLHPIQRMIQMCWFNNMSWIKSLSKKEQDRIVLGRNRPARLFSFRCFPLCRRNKDGRRVFKINFIFVVFHCVLCDWPNSGFSSYRKVTWNKKTIHKCVTQYIWGKVPYLFTLCFHSCRWTGSVIINNP